MCVVASATQDEAFARRETARVRAEAAALDGAVAAAIGGLL